MWNAGQATRHDTGENGTGLARLPRTLIVSDTRLLRDGIAAMLSSTSVCVIERMVRVDAAAAEVKQSQPDIVLLDASAFAVAGFPRELRQAGPAASVIVFALGASDQTMLTFAQVGVSALLSRNGSVQDLASAINQTWRDRTADTQDVAALLFTGFGAVVHTSRSARPAELTPRQRQIVPFLQQGLSNKEIARLLGIELGTVKNHVHDILARMQMSRRGQIACRW